MGVMLMFPYKLEKAVCGIAVKNVALSLSMVGHPSPRVEAALNPRILDLAPPQKRPILILVPTLKHSFLMRFAYSFQ